jgi:hypothetical protein
MTDLARKMLLGEHAVEGRRLPYALRACPVCGEEACSPTTGVCGACEQEERA